MRSLVLAAWLIALPLLAAEDPEPGPTMVGSGTVTLAVGVGAHPLAASFTVLGPLFDIAPFVELAGATLAPGPLGQSWALDVGEQRAIFGLSSPALAIGRRIVNLSQPPRLGDGGSVHVPLDLLNEALAGPSGLQLTWSETTQTLTVERRAARELEVQVDMVDLPGVTTIVLRFGARPRYRVESGESRLRIAIEGDRLAPAIVPPVQGPFVRRLSVLPEAISIELAPGTAATSYELDPQRLVIDLQSGASAESVAATPSAPPQTVIVLDPGHGGEETGAIGPSGAREKDLTLLIAQALRRRLEERLPVRVVLTRDDDAGLGLDQRAAIANQHHAALFVSLHLNASWGSKATGAETYFLSLEASDARAAESAAVENRSSEGAMASAGSGDETLDGDLQLILWDLAQTHHLGESQRFARIVQEELDAALGLRDRGVKQAPFRVMMGAAMPAVLVELGFITNPEEERRLLEVEYRGRLADALARAVQRFLGAGTAPTP